MNQRTVVLSEYFLVVIDCQTAFESIEATRQEGSFQRNRDRTGMLEAISKLQSKFETFVFVW